MRDAPGASRGAFETGCSKARQLAFVGQLERCRGGTLRVPNLLRSKSLGLAQRRVTASVVRIQNTD